MLSFVIGNTCLAAAPIGMVFRRSHAWASMGRGDRMAGVSL